MLFFLKSRDLIFILYLMANKMLLAFVDCNRYSEIIFG